MLNKVAAAGLKSIFPSLGSGIFIRSDITTAPANSLAKFKYGVPGKNWQIAPARIPITAAAATFALINAIAMQYIAIMKFGFIPPILMSEPTKNFRTAPAASKTATRIKSRI